MDWKNQQENLYHERLFIRKILALNQKRTEEKGRLNLIKEGKRLES
jgi:hypothetical protein